MWHKKKQKVNFDEILRKSIAKNIHYLDDNVYKIEKKCTTKYKKLLMYRTPQKME